MLRPVGMCFKRTAVSTLFTFCPPFPPVYAHRRDLDVLVVDDDVDVVVGVGRHFDRRERRLARVIRVERAHANEPMNAHLASQISVRVIALDGERHRVEPRLFAFLVVDDFGFVPALFAIAEVHA